MAKAGVLERDGEILEVLPAGKYTVKLKDTDMVINCYKAGKMKQSHISVIEWDHVKVEVNQIVKRKGRLYVTCQRNPRHKARQG